MPAWFYNVSRLNAKEISLAISLLRACAPAPATATLTLPAAQAPAPFLPGNKPEREPPEHLPEDGSSSLSVGSASGAMVNTSAVVTTSPTWEPVPRAYPDPTYRAALFGSAFPAVFCLAEPWPEQPPAFRSPLTA